MIRFKEKIYLHRSNQSSICTKQLNKFNHHNTARLNYSFIKSINLIILFLIYIKFNLVNSSNESIFNNQIVHTNLLNNSFLNKVLNSKKLSINKAINSVHLINLSFNIPELLNNNLSNYNLKNSNSNKKISNHHQNKRSLNIIEDEITKLTQQQFIKPTLSPLLSINTKLMATTTFKPVIISDNLSEPKQNSNILNNNDHLTNFNLTNSTNYNLTNYNQTHQLIKSGIVEYSFAVKITIFTLLLLLIISTIVGNIFVIAAISLDKNLQTVQNYLVLSLAVADLAVALLVMPPCMISEVYQKWVLGSEMCVFWNLLDVFSCTASILHLLAIALDRYWSVSSLHYSQGRSMQRMMYTIAAIWLAAAVVSMPPLLGVKDPEYESRVKSGKCLMSQDLGYQLFATMSTFYLPSVVILFLYWKIYQVARKRIRNKPGGNQASKHRTHSSKDKTDSLKRTNINTISSRLTIASTTNDLPTQNTSSSQNSDQSKELINKELNKENKQRTKMKANHNDLIPKSNDKVYDTSTNLIKLKQINKYDGINCKNLNNLTVDDNQLNGKLNDKSQDIKNFNNKNQLITDDKTANKLSDERNLITTNKKNRRFHTKYKYIDEDEKEEFNNLNDNNNNKFIQCDNELNKLDNKQIKLKNQLDNLELDNLENENKLTNCNNLPNNLGNNLANNLGNNLSNNQQSNDLQIKNLNNNELKQSNSIELEITTQLDSNLSAQTQSNERRQINKSSSSIQVIASTAIKTTKNHSNLMAKRERKTAKVLAIITGIFMICWLPFFINALLSALFPKSYEVSNIIYSVFQWLGYFNSSLNPLVYTIFSPDFRNGFKKLLTRCKSGS